MSTMVEEKESLSYVLKALDRCDACGAQAYVWVNGVNGDLLFCGHHFAKNENKIREYAYEIIDERERLIEDKSKEAPHA